MGVELSDIVTAGVGYIHEGDKDQPVATASAGVVADIKIGDTDTFVYVGGSGLFAKEDSRAGASLGVYGVPMLGAFAGPKVGVDFGLSDGDAKVHAGGELGFILPAGNTAILFSLSVQATDITGPTSWSGVSVLLSSGGSFSKI